MRTHGTLTKWNDDRGFGFIEPAGAAEEIFVHVSAFPRDHIRPRIGELISFEIDVRGDGRKQAVHVMRPGSRTVPRDTRRPSPATSPFGTIAGLLAIVALGWYAYSQFVTKRSLPPTPAARAIQTLPPAPTQRFACDGRTRCPQMTSCAEATYFINHCPGTQMDGDGDGEPCERQWCSGGRAE